MKIKISILFLFLLSFSFNSQSQTTKDSSLVRIEMINGNEFIGEIVNQDSARIYLQTEDLGELTILKRNIKTQEKIQVQQIRDGKLWSPNPQSTRYFWSPNGYGLPKGEGYYQNIWVLWNQFSYGVTNNFSLGGGIIPLFLFGGTPTPLFGTAKFSIPIKKDRINLGAGAIVGTVLGEDETGFGIVYGLSTFGSPDNNVTVGMGYGFAAGEWASSPLINVNGMFRVSSHGYIITENYYINAGSESGVLLSVGGRWIIKKAALDFGLFMPIAAELDRFIAIPWLGFTIPFGHTSH